MPARMLRVSAVTALLLILAGTAGPAAAAPNDRVADAVLGQPSFSTNLCNNGGVSASSQCKPYDVAADPTTGRLYVVEDGTHRILSWPDGASYANHEPADMVIGQPDFSSGNGPCEATSSTTFCNPSGAAVDAFGNLYVADRKNSRIVEFDNPVATDAVADRVFGQPDFTSNQCNQGGIGPSTLCRVRGVAITPDAGILYASDQQNNRVLVYLNPLTTDSVADLVIGQPDFATKGCTLSATGLCEPRGIGLDPSGNLWVSDANNHRVLGYLDPATTDAVADQVLGQSNFTSGLCNRGGGASAQSVCRPRDVAADSLGNVFVADTGNSRALLYFTPLSTDTKADAVFGQRSFSGRGCNSGGVSATSLCSTRGIGVDATGNLQVADTDNNRVLRFDLAI